MPICFVVHLFITIVNDGYLSVSLICNTLSLSKNCLLSTFNKLSEAVLIAI